jgi:hypothetical protein
MKKQILAILIALLVLPSSITADEGMWLPFLIKNQKYKEMKKIGLKLPAEALYSDSKPSITQAVVGFMGEGANLRSFGTGSFISGNGLIITNYHVVLSYLERFSNEKNDFLKYGYWAENLSEESLCRDLEIKILESMKDVTDIMLAGTEGLEGNEKQNKINENGIAYAKLITKGTKKEVKMQAIFGNNRYIMSVYSIYKDIRMVAAPPFSIGKFGGNTDNYNWPRHTGDFAILRVYAGKDNQPASYSKENVPFKPKRYLKISLEGTNENEFAMTIGFPGTTRQYIPSFAIDKIINGENRERIAIRSEKMHILESAIESDETLKFRYSTKLSSVGNSYLRWKGELLGVNRMNLVEQKRNEEQLFAKWVKGNPEREAKYGKVLEQMEDLYKEVSQYKLADLYFNEAGINGSEIVPFIGKFEKLVATYARKKPDPKASESESKRLLPLTAQFFNNWDYETDRKMFRDMLKRYYEKMPERFHPEAMDRYVNLYQGDIEKLSEELFANSIFTDKSKLEAFLTNQDRDIQTSVKSDPLYQISIGYYMINVDKIMRQRGELQQRQMTLFSTYIEGILEMNRDKTMYPDANGSLRFSYGTIKGGEVSDGLSYRCRTTLYGVMDKFINNPEDKEFYMPKKLQTLLQNRDFGKYADKSGELNVNFLTNNHTTGGNSGSPVLNGKGELIGVNFDRIWQGVASDYRYDSATSRAIAVDIRYIIFLLDKFSPSRYIVAEIEEASR